MSADVPHLIGGRSVASAGGATFETVDPATGSGLATVALGGVPEVDAAVRAAGAAGERDDWRRLPPAERARLLRSLAEVVRSEAESIAVTESRDSGHPIEDARADVAVCAEILEYYATLPENVRGTSYAEQPGFLTTSRREPYGVVAAIAPWNFPFFFAVTKTGPALATGNTVVLKMAEQTPLTAAMFGELCARAGFPPGVVNVVNGDASTGAALVAHPGVSKITFTGSTEVGALIQRSGVSCHLELGGKTANIVTAHADLETAAAASVFHAFFNAGQVCTAGSRLLLAEEIAEEFLELFLRATANVVVGDPMDPATQMGPLVSREHREGVERAIDAALAEGATIAHGGGRPRQEGAFLQPTVLDGVTPSMAAAREEIFGPVVSVLRYRGLDEAVRLANDTSYGLAATVWTDRLDEAVELTDRLQAGIVWTNAPFRDHAHVPYEGHKASGRGEEGGLETIREFTKLKVNYLAHRAQPSPWEAP
ncbi:aldehyde dehydrogenase family protein [Nonomuraea sp. NPDC059023]|uniref:aldehyde dehydrogenase family protein n=1 Tax=unclassified Nonomuraea TaxID=2593643 RepID=UPI0036945BDD